MYRMLKKMRKELHLTQTEVADSLGIDQRQWSRYENGKNEFPLRYLKKLCENYEISADWLLGLQD